MYLKIILKNYFLFFKIENSFNVREFFIENDSLIIFYENKLFSKTNFKNFQIFVIFWTIIKNLRDISKKKSALYINT